MNVNVNRMKPNMRPVDMAFESPDEPRRKNGKSDDYRAGYAAAQRDAAEQEEMKEIDDEFAQIRKLFDKVYRFKDSDDPINALFELVLNLDRKIGRVHAKVNQLRREME